METELVITGKGKDRIVKCKHCFSVIARNNKDRWRSHLSNCDSVPEDKKRSLKLKRTASLAFVETQSSILESVGDSSIKTSTPLGSSKLVHTNISQWVDRVNSADDEKLDQLFANIFYQTGVPVRLAYHDSLRQFVRRLRPAYELPSSKRIAGALLIKAHLDLSKKINEVLDDAKYLHIVSDGWSSLRRDHYVNFIAVLNNNEMKPILLQTINTDEESQDGINIEKDICNFIESVGGSKVASLVTDNAKNMQKA